MQRPNHQDHFLCFDGSTIGPNISTLQKSHVSLPRNEAMVRSILRSISKPWWCVVTSGGIFISSQWSYCLKKSGEKTPGMYLKPCVNDRINYQPQLVRRISSTNSRVNKFFWCFLQHAIMKLDGIIGHVRKFKTSKLMRLLVVVFSLVHICSHKATYSCTYIHILCIYIYWSGLDFFLQSDVWVGFLSWFFGLMFSLHMLFWPFVKSRILGYEDLRSPI